MKECDNCGYKTKTTKTPKSFGSNCQEYNLCKICSSTRLSNAVLYPTSSDYGNAMLEGIAYIGNLLLEEIRKQKNSPPTKQ